MKLFDSLKAIVGKAETPTDDVEESGPEVMDCSPSELGEPLEGDDDFDEDIDEETELHTVRELAERGLA